jgi:hypothetical protein
MSIRIVQSCDSAVSEAVDLTDVCTASNLRRAASKPRASIAPKVRRHIVAGSQLPLLFTHSTTRVLAQGLVARELIIHRIHNTLQESRCKP